MELLRLEGTLKIISYQPPFQEIDLNLINSKGNIFSPSLRIVLSITV